MAKKEKEFSYEYNPVKETIGGKEAEKVIWTTKSLNMAVDALSQGLPLKANPFCGKNTKLLRPDLVYKRTQEELEDYIRCKEDPVYFGEKCYLMTPEGLQQCKLRDYQIDYLNHLKNNRFSMILSCRQSGKCLNLLTNVKICLNNKEQNIQLLKLFYLYGLSNEEIKELSNYDYSEKIIRQIEIFNDLQILTDTGYKKVTHLYLTKPFENYIIRLENGYELECADEHIVFKEDFSKIFVKDLLIGDYILTDNGPSKVIYIENTHIKVCMGDLTVDDENHRFYSNGILSHNSVITGIYTLWKTIFNIDNNALVLSKSGKAGVDLVKKIKDMYLYLPYHLKAGTLKWNQSGFSLDNNSSIQTEAFSPTAGVGSTINTLVLDEFAWCPPNDVELFYENVIPTVTTMPNSNVCIMSTQNGFNKFYQLWNGAITGKNNYAPFKVDWYQVPNFNPKTKQWEPRTEEWKEMMIGVLGSEEAFYYQYGTQFSSSDKCLISREKLAEIRDNTILYKTRETELDNLVMLNPNNLFWDPNYDLSKLKENYYVITIDLAEGGGGDYTIFNICEIVEKDKFNQVGYYRTNKVSIEDVAADFWLMCSQLFNQEHYIVSIEWNTYGALFYQYILQLNEQEYRPELMFRFNFNDELDLTNIVHYKKGTQEEIDINGKKSNRTTIPGIRFSHNNKVTGCILLKMMIEKDEIVMNDIVTISELENFEDKTGNGSYKASFGHDDLILSFVQFPMLKNTVRYKNFMEDIDMTKQMKQLNIMNNSFDFYNQQPYFNSNFNNLLY